MFHTLSFKIIFCVEVGLGIWLVSHSLSEAHQDKHFLHYKFTALTRADTFPEFSAEGVCDDRRVKHYSDEEKVWERENLTYWTGVPAEPPETREWYLDQLYILSKCKSSTNCSELHVLQRIIGCELKKRPDGSVSLTVFDEYGFDGEDFIAFNPYTMHWINTSPNATEAKEKWNHQTRRNKLLKYFLKICADWISTFNNTKASSPDVRVSASKAPGDQDKLVLTCLATGFYPRDVQMDIRLDRTKLEGQTSEIRPNHDETFQMRTSVKIHRNCEGSYDCLVNHSSLTEPVSVHWDGKCCNCEPQWPVRAAVGGGVFVLVFLAVIGSYIYKNKRPNGLMRSCQCYGAVTEQDGDDD